MRFMITRKSSDPVTNGLQTFRDQKEANFMERTEEPIASRKRVRQKASRKLARAHLSIPPVKASLYTKRTILTMRGNGRLSHAHSPDGGDLATAVSKLVTKMVRHHDQDERQLDGSMH